MKNSFAVAASMALIVAAVMRLEGAAVKEKLTVKESVVYSYSTVNATGEGPPRMIQLTIATGPDAKYHYVKSENGNTTKGIWDGPLPATPYVERAASDLSSTLETVINNPELTLLSNQIDSSIQEYVNKALMGA